MTYSIRTLFVGLLMFSFASGAFAAGEPSITVKRATERAVSVRFENIPDGSTLRVVNSLGVVVKEEVRLPRSSGRKDVRLPETLLQGTYTIEVRNESSVVAHTTFVHTIPAPTCRMTASSKVVHIGDFVTFRWSSENADKAYIFGNKEVETRGSQRMAVYHAGKNGLTANVIGRGGISGCSARILIKE